MLKFRLRSSEEEREADRQSRTVFVSPGESETGFPYRDDETDKPLGIVLGIIGEVQKLGVYGSVFRYGGLEFRTKAGAVKSYIDHLVRDSLTHDSPSLEGRTREKTALECGEEIKQAISAAEAELTSKLGEVLKREGPWRSVLISSIDDSLAKRESDARGREDLADRLDDCFGSRLVLWLTATLKPEIFRKAIENLPAGETESDLMTEAEGSLKRDRAVRQRRIEEARDFLRGLQSGRDS